MRIVGFPMPPSSNQLYASFKGRFIKSVVGRKYDASINAFKLIKSRQLDKIKAQLKPNQLLHIDTVFVFHRKRVIGAKGQIKKLDASNRIKQAHDSIARLLEIDDSYFVQGAFSKAICEHEGDEQIIITIRPAELLTLDQLLV